MDYIGEPEDFDSRGGRGKAKERIIGSLKEIIENREKIDMQGG